MQIGCPECENSNNGNPKTENRPTHLQPVQHHLLCKETRTLVAIAAVRTIFRVIEVMTLNAKLSLSHLHSLNNFSSGRQF